MEMQKGGVKWGQYGGVPGRGEKRGVKRKKSKKDRDIVRVFHGSKDGKPEKKEGKGRKVEWQSGRGKEKILHGFF